MKIWVGVTDGDWFEFLRTHEPDEVNFWQPSGAKSFRALQPGEPFLFKLRSPRNFIVGGGFFVRHTALPFSVAWEAFGPKNGAFDVVRLRERITRLRPESEREQNPVIGCNILTEPFFWPDERWIPVPVNWSKNIVQGKTYDTVDPVGAALWQEVQLRSPGEPDRRMTKELDQQPRYGAEYLTHARLGQGAFRVLVTDAYQKRCAITGERTLPVLEAAHIQPYASEGPHRVSNGLLLRSDLHTLFDRGYMTVTPDLRVLVSKRIREEFANGRDYYAHHDKSLRIVPHQLSERPDPVFLRWHNQERYERGAAMPKAVQRDDG